mmetsp:Transcript_61443/g.139082  ORF Transcript_61443/g.139082 Transcript_61443/m.139082 type:complete len:262 (+) Transcript_61443:721-1506(+)
MLSSESLRILSPSVVAIELALPVLIMICPTSFWPRTMTGTAALAVLFHLGIGLSMNGAGLLSAAAAVAWIPLIPTSTLEKCTESLKDMRKPKIRLGSIIFFSFICASIYFEVFETTCADPRRDTFRTILHNRWNVFAGTDTEVVWEIMPGALKDGSVIDVWRSGENVSWSLPKHAARQGRWRSFPMVSASDGASEEELDSAYGYFCREWNEFGGPGSQDCSKLLTRFKAFMLRAPLDDTAQVSKRLLREQNCPETDSCLRA